jgi:isoamylase
MLATLMLSQGTPMVLAGDELGNSQQGNNNAYCQDNPVGWINWAGADPAFLRFCQRIIRFRRAHPVLRQARFLHSQYRLIDGKEDLFWRRPDGDPMTGADWGNPDLRVLAVEMRTASGTPAYAALETAIFAVFNTGAAVTVTLPDLAPGLTWVRQIDTSAPDADPRDEQGRIRVAANSVVALVQTGASPRHPKEEQT